MNIIEKAATAVKASVDFNARGKQHGHLSLPYSRDSSAWGSVKIPICVINNGEGPTVTMIGGSHGDEYEGPITLLNLASQVSTSEISGRLILLPCLNAPAVQAAKRLSPIDNQNMNRIFPGDANGSISSQIANFVSTHIIAESDIVLDLHAGGKTLDFAPLAAVHFLDDAEQQKKAEELMIAFGAPNSLRMRELDDRGMLDTLVESSGKIFVTTELGGGGTATRESIEITSVGCRNLLIACGLLEGEITLRATRMLEMPEENCFIVAEGTGMLEMCASLGSTVYQGTIIARIHDMNSTGVAAREISSPRDGVLMARHFPGLIGDGDCLAVIAEEVHR